MAKESFWRETFLPEHELLLCCARTRFSDAHAVRVRELIAAGVNWESVLSLALNHRVMPLLYHSLASLADPAVPEAFMVRLASLFRVNTLRNLLLTAELAKIIAVFDSLGMAIAAYKGPVLAAAVYGDATLRQSADLDLVTAPGSAEAAMDVLEAAGFKARVRMTPRQRQFHVAHGRELEFSDSESQLILDLHWRFANDFGGGPDVEASLARVVSVTVEGREVASLHPEDLLLVLCLNGVVNLWPQLITICDVAQLISSQRKWDWPRLLERSEEEGLLQVLLLGVYLAYDLIGEPVPTEVTEGTQSTPSVLHLRSHVWGRLFTRGEQSPGSLEVIRFLLRVMERRGQRAAYFWVRAAVPTTNDFSWLPLPDQVFFLYFLVRLLRLCARGLSKLYSYLCLKT